MDMNQVNAVLSGQDPSDVGVSSIDAARLKIANELRKNDYHVTLKTPTRVTFNYLDDNGDEVDDETTALSLNYYDDEDDGGIYAVTDHEFFKEIPLDALWDSSIEAIANFSI